MDGIEACRQIRSFSDAHIVMLTATAEEIVELSAGADDYVTKPFLTGELIVPARAMLRRPRATRQHGKAVRRFADLEIERAAHEVLRGGEPVELMKIEVDLVDALSGEPRIASRQERLLE